MRDIFSAFEPNTTAVYQQINSTMVTLTRDHYQYLRQIYNAVNQLQVLMKTTSEIITSFAPFLYWIAEVVLLYSN